MADVDFGRRVLISGVAGYIGSHVALGFLDAGWRVVGIDDLSVGTADRVPDGVEFYPMAVASEEVADLLARRPVEAVLHFAARISVAESMRFPALYFHNNSGQAAQFFETVGRSGVEAFVFSSTAAVYGEVGATPVDEDHPTRPLSPYGRSKLAAEWALADTCAATGMRHVTLRYFNVAGADPDGRAGPRDDAQHLIKILAEAAVGRRSNVTIFGSDYDTPDGTAIRDYIHVADLAAAHLSAVEYLLGGGANLTANCGYGRGYSVREVIEAARALAPSHFAVTEGPRRPGDVSRITANAARIHRHLRWVPRHERLEDILRHAIDWERKCRAPASA